MKIFRLFTIAAAALMMAACSEDVTQIINGGKKEFTATIAAPNKGGTRTAYNESGGVINVAWTVGDKIALVHNGVKDVVTVTAVDNTTGKATISGYITNATNGAAVTLVYPAALVQTATGSNNYDPDLTNLRSQDGTLGYIQEKIDFREDNTPTLSVDGTGVTLSSDANLSSKIAILKLTLKDNAVSPATLNATQVKINKGTDILASTTSIDATSEVYLAVPSVTTSSTLTIEATVDGSPYTYTKDGVTVVPQKYYQSTVNLSKTIVLSTVTDATTIQDGYTVTGTLDVANHPVQISIAAGATVTLADVTIDGAHSGDFKWAGITCAGDATIILKDGTTNTVKGFFDEYPGIQAAVGHTLIIQGGTEGTGKLIASSNGYGAGIGGGNVFSCGNIEIQGGTVWATGDGGTAGIGSGDGTCGNITISGGTVRATGGANAAGIGSGCNGNGASCGAITISGGTVEATGGENGAGIGSGNGASCGTITISGGTVTATGGTDAAGIGSGYDGSCGNITITSDVTSVTATKGASAPNSIGKGAGSGATCGTVTIGGTMYWDGSAYQNGGGTKLPTSPYIYPTPAPANAINGKFTINNTGKQVYFAKGNLQAVFASAGTSCTWQFAANQYDFIGNAGGNILINGNGSVSAAGTVDLFGWSTAATTYGIHNSTDASDYSGAFVDWGGNSGNIGTGWRTLTKNEWDYLFLTRTSGSKVNGMSPSPDNARYTHATITDIGTDGIHGIILFPDGVTINYSDATYWGKINQNSSWSGSTKCTTSQWNALAAKGFVFLPAAGVRNGIAVSNPNDNGYYWSSTPDPYSSTSAHYTRVVASNEPTTDYDSRKIGISVRLVYPIE